MHILCARSSFIDRRRYRSLVATMNLARARLMHMQRVRNHMMQACRRQRCKRAYISEPKWPHLILVKPPLISPQVQNVTGPKFRTCISLANKCSSMLVLRSNLNLVVATLQVQAGEDVAACQQSNSSSMHGKGLQSKQVFEFNDLKSAQRRRAPHFLRAKSIFLACKQHRVAIWRSRG